MKTEPKPTLPPHLIEALARFEKRGAEKSAKFGFTVRDVTPKGYGPNE